MNVVVSLEQRFLRTPDGAVWTSASFAYPFWTRYLEVFDQVRIVARVRDVPANPPAHLRVDGPAVAFIGLPYYVGPVAYLLRAAPLRRTLAEVARSSDALILRTPSVIATILTGLLRDRRPYGVEVVGDPWDVFAPGTIRHPLRPLFRRWFARQLRHQCAHACAAAYVTRTALQQRYPPGETTLHVSCSDVELSPEAFVAAPRLIREAPTPLRLVYVGSLDQLYKAPDVLLDAVAICVRTGMDVQLAMIGDGRYRPLLEAQAQRLGIAARVVWHGMLPAGEAVRTRLDAADLFVLPSRTEGLPRALIEAMARALPCIGSTVGGIPELLPPEDLAPPGDATALATIIQAAAANPSRMTEMSARNLAIARTYADHVLREQRLRFYRAVRDAAAQWSNARSVQRIGMSGVAFSTSEGKEV